MRKPLIAQIAIPVPLFRLFDYLLPENIEIPPDRGCRVKVPFGSRQKIGMIISISDSSDFPVSRLKSINEIIDSEPVLDNELFELLGWASRYYHHPLGEVIFSALPKQLKQGAEFALKQEDHWSLTELGRQASTDELKRAKKQAALLTYLQESAVPELQASHLNAHWDNWRTAIQALVAKKLVQITQKVQTAAASRVSAADHAIQLNEQQHRAASEVVKALNGYQTFLLQGITGSGKTEVYLEIIQQVLDDNRQVLVLVPEISLTPQLTRRFTERLDTCIASLHSGLNDSQRHTAWVQASQGIARVVIGTRSALFTALPELGLIILDEEHDASFKQQEGFRYHARDLALVRAKNRNIPVLMGSATPSFESLENVSREHFKLLKLTVRGVKKAVPPKVSLLDVCQRPMEDGISDRMLAIIASHLENNGQVLLFLNRRGYAPLLMCHECGWTSACQRCDANMTLHHHNKRLCCHHCGYEKQAPSACPDCGHESLYIPGAGTERIEIALTEKFPSAVISRIDRDTTRRKGELDKKLAQARSGESQILIGTQMLAKGHDFPNVTLVGILNIDQGLFSADFRGTEHMAQLIIQVSGRAGRGERPGEVVIQTHHPEHPLLHSLLETGYNGFAQQAILERKQACFPPFGYMAMVRCESVQKESGQAFLNECRAVFNFKDVQVFGPLPAPMERRAGRYRWQLILLSDQRKNLHGALRHGVPAMSQLKVASKVRWSVDIDPQDMF